MPNESRTPDLGIFKERQQKIWTTGDYTRLGNPLDIQEHNAVQGDFHFEVA